MPASPRISRTIQHRGLTIPNFLYGTAWKEEQTEILTESALNCGFFGIDTANQRRHYYEAGVGNALRRLLNENRLRRSDIFVQTKFTYISSQDHRLPYDAEADYSTQVRQSFQSSLEHLGTTYIDSYILHGPATHQGLTQADREVWRAMEGLQRAGLIRILGISNVNLEQIQLLLDAADIKPAFVQNRCYARTKWDFKVREFCRRHDIIYQGFSLLTANTTELNRPELFKIAKKHSGTTAQTIFRFALQSGMVPLTGTCSLGHMQEDLAVYAMELSDTEMAVIENIAG